MEQQQKPNKNQSKWRLIALLLFAMVLVCGAGGNAGTMEDPLVSKSWVDQYVYNATKPLEQRIDKLALELGGNHVIEMWIHKKEVKINGKAASIDVPPILQNNRTMLPFRYLGEELGAKVDWDNQNKKATYTKGGVKLVLTVGKKQLSVNGVTEALDVAPILKDSRVLVPVRVVSDKLGAKVDWAPAEKKVTVTYGIK